MKTILKLIPCLLLFAVLLSACKKDEGVGTVGVAKVNVINAIVGGGKIKVQVGANVVPWSSIPEDKALGEDKGLARLFIVPADQSTYFKAVSLSDSSKIWYNQSAQLGAGKKYTLCLSGTPGNIKTSFKEESNFPKYIVRDAGKATPKADSVVNVRFVNLSPSGPAVDVNIQGKSTNEASSLSYEAFTEFKAYPFKKNENYIVFEVRKSSDKELIANYYLYVPSYQFKSVAVVMKGIYPGAGVPYSDQYTVEVAVYQ